MDSAVSVQGASVSRKGYRWIGSARRALVNVVLTKDIFGLFSEELGRMKPRRIEIISPWLGDGPDLPRVQAVLDRAARFGAPVVLTTRSPDTEAHQAVVDAVSSYANGRVIFNEGLHAKLYICEDQRRRGLAVVGSANLSRSSTDLDESAVVIRPLGP